MHLVFVAVVVPHPFHLVVHVSLAAACGHEVETIPGISSAQILASKSRVCFDETSFITFHRCGEIDRFKSQLVQVLKEDRNAIVIPRPWKPCW